MKNLHYFETKISLEKMENGIVKINKSKESNNITVTYLAQSPNFELLSNGLIEATYINHITGEPFVLSSILYYYIFKNAIKEINFENNILNPISTSSVDMSEINYNLVKIICRHWLKEVL